MKISSLQNQLVHLPFQMTSRWPRGLPALVWRDVVLVSTSTTESVTAQTQDLALPLGTPVLELDDQMDIELLLVDIFSPLSLVAFSQLKQASESVGLLIDWPRLAELCEYRWSEDFSQMLEIISKASAGFQLWCREKNIGARDLAPLRSVVDLEKVAPYLDQLVCGGPSRSDGVRAIELVVDLFLLEADLESAFQKSPTFSQLFQHLQSLRYPKASAQSLVAEATIKKLPWPKKMHARVARQGDQSGIEIKFFVYSGEDLKKQVEGLAHVSDEMEHQKMEHKKMERA